MSALPRVLDAPVLSEEECDAALWMISTGLNESWERFEDETGSEVQQRTAKALCDWIESQKTGYVTSVRMLLALGAVKPNENQTSQVADAGAAEPDDLSKLRVWLNVAKANIRTYKQALEIFSEDSIEYAHTAVLLDNANDDYGWCVAELRKRGEDE